MNPLDRRNVSGCGRAHADSRYVAPVLLRRAGAVALAMSLVMLPGCAREPTGASATQVLARVGGAEISMLQFNHALKTLGIANPDDPVRREVTEKLIDRELAPARSRYELLLAEPARIEEVLLDGARKARAWATPFLARIREAVGIRRLA